jgi:predicted nuclease of predicted toxin-antitoxin system
VKFNVDAQLPRALSEFIILRVFDSINTLDFPDKNHTKDSQISRLAMDENRIVVSMDLDFLESFLLKSEPEKLNMVKTGNIFNSALIKIFDENLALITRLLSKSNFIEIDRKEIAEHG